jgi:septal ring factor EnvC (AmiA/AmiB activator)
MKEISEKDIQVGFKEDDIYKLKKKTQELGKFKFVLDYKIKDLKRAIAPREATIKQLQLDTEKMDDNLKTCNATNSALGFTVDDLRSRQESMQEIIKTHRSLIRENDITF